MGAFASWAALAATHHLTLRFLSDSLGLSHDLYVILGDDLVIADKDLAKAYRQYMTEKLGVNISVAKSFAYEDQLQGFSAEFAKSLFRDGRELTPISPILLKEVYHDHQWWKMIDIFKYIRNVLGIAPLIGDDESIMVPLLYDRLSSRLSERSSIETIMTHPRSIEELTPLERLADVPTRSLLNPWVDEDKDRLRFLEEKAARDRLLSIKSSFEELLKGLRSEKSGKLGGMGLENPFHPVTFVVEDLGKVL